MVIASLRRFLLDQADKRGVPAGALDRFRRDEGGAIIIFGLMIFIVMLVIGGMGVDLMRHERLRVDLQQTLDRSVLAAANMEQDLDKEEVVRDYFAKSGLASYLTSVDVESSQNSSKVTATASGLSPNFFLDMVGKDNLAVNVKAQALQGIGNIEIVMVLDLSGSMNETSGGTSKVARLREAANTFVADMLDNGGAETVSIAIVPYNSHVNVPDALIAKYNVRELADPEYVRVPEVNCLDFPASIFGSTHLSRDFEFRMIPSSDFEYDTRKDAHPYVGETSQDNNAGATMKRRVCGFTPKREDPQNPTIDGTPVTPKDYFIQLPTNNLATLQARIKRFYASGRTSITLGMRWGVALLDPQARPMFSELVREGAIPNTLAGRPFNYNDGTLKVLVLMTDGRSTHHPRMDDAFKMGWSPIFVTTATTGPNAGKYTIQHPSPTVRPSLAGTNTYWVPHMTTNTNTAGMAAGWKAGVFKADGTISASIPANVNSGPGWRRLRWEEVWARQRVSWVAWQFYGRALGGTSGTNRNNIYTARMKAFLDVYPISNASDTYTGEDQSENAHIIDELERTLDLSCTAAKAQGVLVYAIALEVGGVGSDAANAMQKCASPSSGEDEFFFAPSGSELGDAFDKIAVQIDNLRLTQ